MKLDYSLKTNRILVAEDMLVVLASEDMLERLKIPFMHSDPKLMKYFDTGDKIWVYEYDIISYY